MFNIDDMTSLRAAYSFVRTLKEVTAPARSSQTGSSCFVVRVTGLRITL